ncbi:PREDICTED: uncharacterized protein LOC108767459 [Trachymyrmex cornetzi]|uniref:uncharacterized protein LOC108767459 n=1 Tax=Trachymyrmex cornetzi TaxID=471704 RepID=UPI00084F4E12|nr:PREDICTED: uncharacterized protein LOC108767459 [Trachymyrmex cornetzi]
MANSSKIRAEAQPFTPTASNAPVAASNNHVANKRTDPPADTVPSNVLLATAWVDIHTTEGRSFKTLRTKRQRSNLQVTCFGEKFTGVARSRVVLTLKPCSSAEPAFPLHAYVFQNITSYAASRTQPVESWPHLQGISFADPDSSSRHRIHLLIGADLYGSLLKNGLRQGPIGMPTAQLTALSWILSGPTGRGRIESENICVCHNVSTHDTNSLLRQFWEDEEVSRPPPLTDEEERCEQHFLATHSRSPEGRYIVRLPFRHELPIDIGDSLPIATVFYEKMERKLRRHAELSAQYNDFLAEYLALGHMSAIESPSDTALTPVYIPHHSVLRETSSTTKLRVVFNASCKTTNGTSLNDHLLVGPKLQQDLPAILLRWLQWRFVMRQISPRCSGKSS